MIPEDPSRHSKKPDEPVIIDLSAEDVTEAEKSRLADEPSQTAEAEIETVEQAETIDSAPETADRPQPEAETARPVFEPQQTVEKPRQQPATAALIAAGIFGGIVALAGAGSMQYAGYLPGASPAIDNSALTSEIEALKAQVATLVSAPAPQADTGAIEQRLTTLEQAAANPAVAGDDGVVSALQDKLAGLTETVDRLSSAAGEAQSGTGQLTQRLDAIEKKLSEPQNDGTVARTIALTAIKAAIDRGGPFVTELETLSSVSPDDPAVTSLQPFATAGVASRADLVKQFEAAAPAILEAVNQPDPNAGLGDRLLTSAMSLVTVRDVGNVEGATPEAVIARIEDKVKRGDLKAAVTEWDGLPEAGKAAAAGFKKALDERMQIEDLVNAAVTAGNKQI
ncbi:mitofilin family membrane protein [Rhizobium sp. LjRoot30]|uniref:COG4223 family protein n=1 Tax=Rhizobium sp. LjRoot30 TaxID=3342320 RepID=UPI003ECC203A